MNIMKVAQAFSCLDLVQGPESNHPPEPYAVVSVLVANSLTPNIPAKAVWARATESNVVLIRDQNAVVARRKSATLNPKV